MSVGNFIRDWTVYGDGFSLRVQIDAIDYDAMDRAKSQLRTIAAGRPPDLAKEEDDDGSE